jgi:hypothetical protein
MLLTNLEMMYSKIKKYYAEVLANTKPDTLLERHLHGYVRDVVDKLIFPIKVDDSIDRFKGPILNAILDIESGTALLEQIIASAMQTKRVSSKEDGWSQALKMLNYIKSTFGDIESYTRQLDEKNQTYIRITRQKLTYMLSMDTSIKGNIVSILRDAKNRTEDEGQQIGECFNLFDVKRVIDESFYHPRKRHVKRGGEELGIEDAAAVSQEDINAVIDTRAANFTVAKVNEYVQSALSTRDSLHARDVEVVTDDDYLMAIFLAMNSADRHSVYQYESTGDSIRRGIYEVPNFTLKRKGDVSHDN